MLKLTPQTQAALAAAQVSATYKKIAMARMASLVEVHTGKRFDLGKCAIGIGRSLSNDIVIEGDVTISRLHAQILFANGCFYLTDLKSANGTLCNARAVDRAVRLRPDDIIYVGRRKFVFCPTKHHHFYLRGEYSATVQSVALKYGKRIVRPILNLLASIRGAGELRQKLG
ncbi:MAG: FHA domain-containing protein [Terriglobales bacterium]